MMDNDPRDEYYKRKEAKHYIGGGGIYRLLLGGLLFIFVIMEKTSLTTLELVLWGSFSIALITFGLKAYIRAIQTVFKL